MREIKFRGQRTLTKQWVYGNLMIKREESPVPETTELYTQHYIVPIDGLDYYEYEVDPSTIGQYTGLKDKNGKEIYEGDILEQESFFGYPIRHVVGWSEENALFTAKLMQDDFPTSRIAQYWVSKKAVIGNIHDNPELLKGGEL